MYSLDTGLTQVHGIGPKLAEKFAAKNIHTVKDLLLFVPLRYEDRSRVMTIDQARLNPGEFATIQAKVLRTSNYYRSRKSIQNATIADETGKMRLIWFNNPWVIKKLSQGSEWLFSGKVNDRGMIAQATVEAVVADTIHSGRIIPLYSQLSGIKQGSLRRILKKILDEFGEISDPLAEKENKLLPLNQVFQNLHFPEKEELTIKARERLSLEELLTLIKRAGEYKKRWQKEQKAVKISANYKLPDSIPFELTNDQKKACKDILADLSQDIAMNRLLIGDVGSGKTVVAGLAAMQVVEAGQTACLLAPTQILAEQHLQSFAKLFPKLPTSLLTGKEKRLSKAKAQLVIGTHAVINKLADLKPALIIYDEQHRFGVMQRSASLELEAQPHILTLSATPIPRSLMLSIFSHLDISTINELPPGRKPSTTWLVAKNKQKKAYAWVFDELEKNPDKLAIIVCPFIKQSSTPGFEEIKAATQVFKELINELKAKKSQLTVEILHGKLSAKEKQKVQKALFEQKINILVTTPVIEVGLDVPNADYLFIESAERFGLASLHQLRGRVGRAGQESYCLVLPSSKASTDTERLKQFQKEDNGLKLAELDLKSRGAGNLFGVAQTGFDSLRFASWTDFETISKARKLWEKIQHKDYAWQPLFSIVELEKRGAGDNSLLPN